MATAVASKPLKVASTKASTSVALKKPNAANLVSIKDALKAQVALLSSRIAPPTGNKVKRAGCIEFRCSPFCSNQRP